MQRDTVSGSAGVPVPARGQSGTLSVYEAISLICFFIRLFDAFQGFVLHFEVRVHSSNFYTF